MSASPSDIKRSKKESQLLREISKLFMQTVLDDSRLDGLFVNRVQLSPDRGMCTVYLFTNKGKEFFDTSLETLKLYKPSLRRAISQLLPSRYTPDLRFAYDAQFEKQEKIDALFNKLKDEGQL